MQRDLRLHKRKRVARMSGPTTKSNYTLQKLKDLRITYDMVDS